MQGTLKRSTHWGVRARLALLLVGLVWLLVACGGDQKPATGGSAVGTTAEPAAVAAATAAAPAAPATAAAPQKLLKLDPVSGPIGTPFAITGVDLPAGGQVEFVWMTADGSYDMKAGPENVEFYEKKFVEKQMTLGRATTDAAGRVTASFAAPEDYGEVHDVYAVIEGERVARGGFRIMRSVTVSPQSGPIGTPITITVTGLGWKTYESTIALRYDNQFSGIMSAVTTRGTSTTQIRAAGRTGKHVIDINHGAKSAPYLNNQQSGTAHIPDWRFEFFVTDDKAVPPVALDWPDKARAAVTSGAAPTTATGGAVKPAGFTGTLTPDSGPILSQTTFRAGGLPAGGEVELFWVTARGNRVSPSGWSLTETSLATATANAAGAVSAGFEIPDDLGGWHVVKVVQGGKVWAEVPYFVERSLVGVTPLVVKAGETFTVQMKGVGWTELDNGVAVNYDNAYIGFGCGFNSNGDVTMEFVATGGPGIHLIDLYPMIYQGHGKPPWGYQVSLLSYKEDAPGLTLGYRLPVFRLAIMVIE